MDNPNSQLPQLKLDPSARTPLLRSLAHHPPGPEPHLPVTKTHTHPQHPTPVPSIPQPTSSTSGQTGEIYFIGTATVLLSWHGIRLLTDPNFLHAGDHVHLGPGVNATRLTNPAVDLDALPPLDLILLSHYHEDHFDRLVQDALGRDFPIVTTPHARDCLTAGLSEPFRRVYGLSVWQGMVIPVATPDNDKNDAAAAVKITALPGKHVPPGPLAVANDLLGAVPPTNGWMVELGTTTAAGAFKAGYRIYISGDTLMVDELKEIPRWLNGERIDLMLVHLGGTTIPGPHLPLLMVTMDAKQGVELMRLVDPDVTVPIHYDDYSVFASPLEDFKQEVEKVVWGARVVCLGRGEVYRFDIER